MKMQQFVRDILQTPVLPNHDNSRIKIVMAFTEKSKLRFLI